MLDPILLTAAAQRAPRWRWGRPGTACCARAGESPVLPLRQEGAVPAWSSARTAATPGSPGWPGRRPTTTTLRSRSASTPTGAAARSPARTGLRARPTRPVRRVPPRPLPAYVSELRSRPALAGMLAGAISAPSRAATPTCASPGWTCRPGRWARPGSRWPNSSRHWTTRQPSAASHPAHPRQHHIDQSLRPACEDRRNRLLPAQTGSSVRRVGNRERHLSAWSCSGV